MRYIHVPGYRAIIFRRTYPELERSILGESRKWYPGLGGRYNEQKKAWLFPSGATIMLGHLEHKTSVYEHGSAEYAYIGFDELTGFLESQYRFLSSRLRTTAKDGGKSIPVALRAATNPGGVGHDWVRARWSAWLGDIHEAGSGETLYYLPDDVGNESVVRGDTKGALSRQFISAALADNPTLMEADPGYADRLAALPLLVRLALQHGRWDITAEGNVFRREWLQRRAQHAPDELERWFRYYDLAASLKEKASRTATIQGGVHKGTLYLRRGFADRIEWPEQEELIANTMLSERGTRHGVEAKLHGLAAVQALRRDERLMGIYLEGVDVERDKLSRALAWSSWAEEGRVVFCEEGNGAWIGPWVDECTAFTGDGKTFDDRVDAVSGVVQMMGLCGGVAAGSVAVPRHVSSLKVGRMGRTIRDRGRGRR